MAKRSKEEQKKLNDDLIYVISHYSIYGDDRYSIKGVLDLIKRGADVNVRNDYDGNTPIISSVYRKNNRELVKVLLDNGANINAQNNEGDTALMTEIRCSNNLNNVQFLLANGANPNLQNKYKINALMMVINNRFHHLEDNAIAIIEALLAKGADANLQDKNGQSALMRAAKRWFSDIVAIFYKHGVDISPVQDLILEQEAKRQAKIQEEFQPAFAAFQAAQKEMDNATQKLADSTLGELARIFKEAKRNKTTEIKTVPSDVPLKSIPDKDLSPT
ncbi:MAG: ankyrin repeat domain-containing protein [Pseudomonadota bacterium]|mgnify:CR=1 FL=1